MRIGLIPASCKPAHIGHQKLVQLALKECDKVTLYVSLADRVRKGEYPITGKQMREAWNRCLNSSAFPCNINFSKDVSPVRRVYEALGEANDDPAYEHTINVYSDHHDAIQNFARTHLEKYLGNLLSRNQITLRGIERARTAIISGTQMRKFLALGDKASFLRYVPEGIDGELYWKILSS